MTAEEALAEVTARASEFASAIQDAADAGVKPIVLLPALITVFREAGMMPDGFSLPL